MTKSMSNHQVQTSVANLLERQWRFNGWVKKYQMGCGATPCDPCSVMEPDTVMQLSYDSDGNLLDESVQLACVPLSNKFPSERVITINANVRNCELTGCEGISTRVTQKVYVVYCECSEDDEEHEATWEGDQEVVRVFLTNNGAPVTTDEFGNPVPASYLVGKNQLKYLCVVNGAITKLVN